MFFSIRNISEPTSVVRISPVSTSSMRAKQTQAFTLIELLVSISIFAIMTALVVVKYGNFNDSVLMTNLAYDVALSVRTAQTYGLSVKNMETGASQFSYGYGVHFDTDSAIDPVSNNPKNQTIILFVDEDDDKKYDEGTDNVVSMYTVKRGAFVSGVCAGTVCTAGSGILDISFKRPDPKAVICLGLGSCTSPASYAEITLSAADGGTRAVTVRDNGQIAVKE